MMGKYSALTFLLALECGNFPVVKKMLDDGFDVDFRLANGSSAISECVDSGHTELAWLLVNRRCHFNLQCAENYSPLHRAVCNAYYDLVQLLLESGAKVASLDHKGRTPLHLACEMNCIDIAKLLIDHSSTAEVNIMSNAGDTALLVASKNGSPHTISRLLSKGANPNITDKYGNSALHFIVLNPWCSKETVSQLLNAGANVNHQNENSVTPLFRALYNYPPYHEECRARALKICLLLIDQSDLNIKNRLGQSPLHTAIKKNDRVLVQKLISCGCDVDVTDNKGYVPLYYACRRARGHLVKLLIESGANVHALNQYDERTYGNSDSCFLFKLVQEMSRDSRSLSSYCQMVIRKCLRTRNVSSLPLPQFLKQYITYTSSNMLNRTWYG